MRTLFGALVASVICFNAAHATDFSCPKPLAIPDAWNDVNGNGTYDIGIDVYDPVTTGYRSDNKGQLFILLYGTPNGTNTFGSYFPVDFPALNRGNPISGSDQYRYWLAGCAPFILFSADTLLLDSAPLSGATIQGISDLIIQDPSAYWDGTNVVSSLTPSPRVITLPAYDPNYPPESGRSNVVLSKFLTFFVESVGSGSRITGRILDAGTNVPVSTDPTTWGGLKRKY